MVLRSGAIPQIPVLGFLPKFSLNLVVTPCCSRFSSKFQVLVPLELSNSEPKWILVEWCLHYQTSYLTVHRDPGTLFWPWPLRATLQTRTFSRCSRALLTPALRPRPGTRPRCSRALNFASYTTNYRNILFFGCPWSFDVSRIIIRKWRAAPSPVCQAGVENGSGTGPKCTI